MAKSAEEKRADTERKLDIACGFLQGAIQSRMSAGTWGRVTVTAVVENGFVKEIEMDDKTVVRDIPAAHAKKSAEGR